VTGLLVNDYSQRNPPSLGEAMSGLLGNWGGNIEQGLLSALPVLAENDPYKIGQQLLREGAGVGGIAWHGSPHKYLKPDLSKIGTGEGAQAYGHGFYSAEARGVAEEYQHSADWRTKSSREMTYKVNGNEVSPGGIEENRLLNYAMGDRELFDKQVKFHRESAEMSEVQSQKYLDSSVSAVSPDEAASYKRMSENSKARAHREREFADFGGLLRDAEVKPATGHLYKMNIPDETIGKMLDWDKPLFQQSDQVKQILDTVSDPESIQKKIDALQSSLQKFDGDDDLLGLLTGTVKTPPINQKIYKEIERLTNERLQAENLRNRLLEFRKKDNREGSLDERLMRVRGQDFYNHLGGGISPKKLTQRFNNRDEAVEFFKAEKQRFKDSPMSSGKGTYEPVAKLDGDEFTVETYAQFGKTYGQQAASEYLNSLGIPGIKYLDGMSRAAGQGSRNFVSFTPDHIEMLERNGIPMKGLLGE